MKPSWISVYNKINNHVSFYNFLYKISILKNDSKCTRPNAMQPQDFLIWYMII